MKKIFSIFGGLIFCASALVMNSCSENFLDKENPGGIIPEEQFFVSKENALNALNAIYAMVKPDEGGWGRVMLLSCGETPDAQMAGADKRWNTQGLTSDNKDLAEAWSHAYKAIYLANEFLAKLENDGSQLYDDLLLKTLKGEALALRGFFNHFLFTNFGPVPILGVGENFITQPGKCKATAEEFLNYVIQDLIDAAELLDWQPYNGEYGRCTKGMALTYLGDLYLWKAAVFPYQANEFYDAAYNTLMQINASNTYALSQAYGTLWDYEAAWNKEMVWGVVTDSKDWTRHTASPLAGGDGMISLSWEWFCNLEDYLDGQYSGSFDKRAEYGSCYGGLGGRNFFIIDPYIDPRSGKTITFNSRLRGCNPFFFEDLSRDSTFHVAGPHNSLVTSLWSTKYWHTGMVGDNNRTIIYFKRYADVLLDMAICSFKTNRVPEGWMNIDNLRDRAFGNLEVGQNEFLNARFLKHLNQARLSYGVEPPNFGYDPSSYPIPFNGCKVEFPRAEEFYTKFKAERGFRSETLLVAAGMERVKEFLCEPFHLRALVRDGFLEEYINTIYPKNSLDPTSDDYMNVIYTARDWDFYPEKVFWPIPDIELELNEELLAGE